MSRMQDSLLQLRWKTCKRRRLSTGCCNVMFIMSLLHEGCCNFRFIFCLGMFASSLCTGCKTHHCSWDGKYVIEDDSVQDATTFSLFIKSMLQLQVYFLFRNVCVIPMSRMQDSLLQLRWKICKRRQLCTRCYNF